MKQYYTVLGLKEGASQEQIKIAYTKLSKELNPANNDNQEFFKEEYAKVQDAFKALCNSSILGTEKGSKNESKSKQIKTPEKENDHSTYKSSKRFINNLLIKTHQIIKIIIGYIFLIFVIFGIIITISIFLDLNLIKRDYMMITRYNETSVISLFFGLLAVAGAMLLGQVNEK